MARLIINADDCGYFRWVTAGILEAAHAGHLTATGMMANGGDFAHAAARLRECPQVDVGVHLNLTLGRPLGSSLPRGILSGDGTLPGKLRIAFALLRGQLRPDEVAGEWRAQITRCLAAGLELQFLNSHEHVHMLPALQPVIRTLADEFRIRHVRWATTPLRVADGIGNARALALNLLCARVAERRHVPRLVGVADSGRLDVPALTRLLESLDADGDYELMCHPGHDAPAGAVMPAHVRSYHFWQRELATLGDARVQAALRGNAVTLARYRDLRPPATQDP